MEAKVTKIENGTVANNDSNHTLIRLIHHIFPLFSSFLCLLLSIDNVGQCHWNLVSHYGQSPQAAFDILVVMIWQGLNGRKCISQ